MSDSELFELELALPDADLAALGERLIGFEQRYTRLGRAFQMLLDPDSVKAWASKHHRPGLHIVEVLSERYPLVLSLIHI